MKLDTVITLFNFLLHIAQPYFSSLLIYVYQFAIQFRLAFFSLVFIAPRQFMKVLVIIIKVILQFSNVMANTSTCQSTYKNKRMHVNNNMKK